MNALERWSQGPLFHCIGNDRFEKQICKVFNEYREKGIRFAYELDNRKRRAYIWLEKIGETYNHFDRMGNISESAGKWGVYNKTAELLVKALDHELIELFTVVVPRLKKRFDVDIQEKIIARREVALIFQNGDPALIEKALAAVELNEGWSFTWNAEEAILNCVFRPQESDWDKLEII